MTSQNISAEFSFRENLFIIILKPFKNVFFYIVRCKIFVTYLYQKQFIVDLSETREKIGNMQDNFLIQNMSVDFFYTRKVDRDILIEFFYIV